VTHNTTTSPGAALGTDVPRASPADAARTLVALTTTGTLSTLATSPADHPFGSVVSFATDSAGAPYFVISELAEHTRNLRRDPRCSLLVAEAGDDDPLAIGRVTLLGTATPVPDDEQAAATSLVVERVPTVGGYASFGDFSCWHLDVEAVRWVGGFGRMDWVDAASYQIGTVDRVLAGRRGVIDHMNGDHADAGVVMCQHAFDLQPSGSRPTVVAATMEHVDRFGCDYAATTADGLICVRLGFERPVSSVDDVRGAIVALLRAARTS
jgi:hypothetical protein